MTISMMTNAAAVPGAAQVRAARVAQPIAAQPIAAKRQRIGSIDALRGLVMLLMLVDHTREYFYSHAPVSDPMSLATTPPALFFTRFAAHLCAPIFVLLTGLAAWLYAEGRDPERRSAAASSFLLKRGVFLVALEWTVVNFAWTFDPTPAIVYLQVIWAIGLSMIALAAIVHLPRRLVVALGLAIVLGHNVLDPIAFAPGEPGHVIWAVLHDRGMLDLPFGGQARTSYPVLPWIGMIALGWAIGPWFARAVDRDARRRRLLLAGSAALMLFAILRMINGYGEPRAWQGGGGTLATVMSILNLTKYPPSADFLLLTGGIGLILLVAIERMSARVTTVLAVFGSAPLFFYVLHLYTLHALNIAAALVLGATGPLVSVPDVAWIWLVATVVAVPCWFACRSFAAFKRTRTGWWWRYL